MLDRVTVRVRGLMLERLIDRAVAQGARISRAERTGGRELTVVTTASGAAAIEALAEKHGLEAERLAEQGWPRIRRRLADRAPLLVGLVLVLIALQLLSARIWLIDVVALDDSRASRASAARALHDLGVVPGASSASLDPDALALSIQLAAPDLRYAGVRLRGVRLTVEVAAADVPPGVQDPNAARDLVALRDGVVVSVNARVGTAAVKPGDTVRAGQTLIRGEERTAGGLTRGVRAEGEAIARVWYEGRSSEPLSAVELRDTGRWSVSAELRLLDWTIELSRGERYATKREVREILPLVGLIAPLQVRRVVAFEQQAVELPADLARAQAIAAERGRSLALSLVEEGGQPVDEWVTYEQADGYLTARVVIEARIDIAADRAEYIDYIRRAEFE
ncbi:MAG: sporulation protein YqfD [Clostridiales bacterium]|nr:sporulation protein YqfD [Clostridiales bacterium]